MDSITKNRTRPTTFKCDLVDTTFGSKSILATLQVLELQNPQSHRSVFRQSFSKSTLGLSHPISVLTNTSPNPSLNRRHRIHRYPPTRELGSVNIRDLHFTYAA